MNIVEEKGLNPPACFQSLIFLSWNKKFQGIQKNEEMLKEASKKEFKTIYRVIEAILK